MAPGLRSMSAGAHIWYMTRKCRGLNLVVTQYTIYIFTSIYLIGSANF